MQDGYFFATGNSCTLNSKNHINIQNTLDYWFNQFVESTACIKILFILQFTRNFEDLHWGLRECYVRSVSLKYFLIIEGILCKMDISLPLKWLHGKYHEIIGSMLHCNHKFYFYCLISIFHIKQRKSKYEITTRSCLGTIAACSREICRKICLCRILYP